LINLQFAKGQYVNVVTDSFVCPAGWKGFAIPSLAGMILSDTSSNWRSACGRVFKNSIREIDPTYAKPASGYSRYCYSSDGVHNTCYFSVSALTWRGRKVALNCWSQHDKTNFGPLLEFTVILGCCNPRSGIQCPPYQEVTP
jgi:hypothetical protein